MKSKKYTFTETRNLKTKVKITLKNNVYIQIRTASIYGAFHLKQESIYTTKNETKMQYIKPTSHVSKV